MVDSIGDNTGRVTVHCQSTVLSCAEFLGYSEVAPQAIGGAFGDSVSHDKPPIQAQSGVDQRLAQGPIHNSGEAPGLTCVSEEKDGVIFFN